MPHTIHWPTVLGELKHRIEQKADKIELAKLRSAQNNPWFTADHIHIAIDAICQQFLDEMLVEAWLRAYAPNSKQYTIGLICAGNIPAVGFHDVLCILCSNHKAKIKLSSKDPYIIPALLSMLEDIDPAIGQCYEIVEKLADYDAIIATGSNNSLRYFESYFGHVPNIFRHNRTSIGILTADDDKALLEGLAQEIFLHFGLGCRSVSKLYLPENYDLDALFKATMPYSSYATHSKYRNNFVYHTALFQMNKVDYFTNDLLIVLETDELHSPLSVVYVEYYSSLEVIKDKITSLEDQLQVVYCGQSIDGIDTVVPGRGQRPGLTDYADHVDTMTWLSNLNV